MSILIGFICILLSCFLVLVKSPRKTPNLFLAAFLTLTAIELTVWLWGSEATWNWVSPVWLALGKLQMPAFFFFFFSSCYSDFRLKPHDCLHLIPAILALVLSPPSGFNLDWVSDAFTVGTRASWLFSQLTYFGYMAAIVLLLWRFRARFKRHHAGAPSEVLTWLTQMAAASLFARATIIARDFSSSAAPETVGIALQVFGALLALGITTWIAMKSLLQPQLFRDVDRRLLRLAETDASHGSGELKRLTDFVETEKPYIDPELTLAMLADQIAMTPREVSELINQTLGLHFFDFINKHRVDHAKALLVNTPDQTVLQISLAIGFNSKSSFNTAFKKHVGTTPSSFRKDNKN